MRLITITDHLHFKITHLPPDMLDFLFRFKNPVLEIKEIIKKEMEVQKFKPDYGPSERAKTILSFLKSNNIVTTPMAADNGLVSQSIELQVAIGELINAGHDIKVIKDRRPFIYYYNISGKEALDKAPPIGEWKRWGKVNTSWEGRTWQKK